MNSGITMMRQKLCNNIAGIISALKLWQFFRAAITISLDDLKAVLEDAVTIAMETIDAINTILYSFLQALQLAPKALPA